jgi:hypothetical protein
MSLLSNGGATFGLLTLMGEIFGDYNAANAAVVVGLAGALKLPFVLYGAGLIAAALSSGVAYVHCGAEAETYVNSVDIHNYLIGSLATKAWWADHFATLTFWVVITLYLVSLCLFGAASWIVVTKLAAFPL